MEEKILEELKQIKDLLETMTIILTHIAEEKE